MIRAALRLICAVFLILGLLWVYTLMYGGPLGPIFVWLPTRPGANPADHRMS
jgi:hypothetical protein